MITLKMTRVEKTHEKYHRSKIIVHNFLYYLAEFANDDQFNMFCQITGVTFEEHEVKDDPILGRFEKYLSNTVLIEHQFTDISQVPETATPFRGLSNGSLVKCFCLLEGKSLHIFRPNPNYKDIFKPLSLMQSIKYKEEHGVFDVYYPDVSCIEK